MISYRNITAKPAHELLCRKLKHWKFYLDLFKMFFFCEKKSTVYYLEHCVKVPNMWLTIHNETSNIHKPIFLLKNLLLFSFTRWGRSKHLRLNVVIKPILVDYYCFFYKVCCRLFITSNIDFILLLSHSANMDRIEYAASHKYLGHIFKLC